MILDYDHDWTIEQVKALGLDKDAKSCNCGS